jgi:AcrR family transcriptional regulator
MARSSKGKPTSSDDLRVHPTRVALIDAVLELLKTKNPEDIRIEDVLAHSGISSGSLYYHFDNFPDLIDQAIISLYATDIDLGIAILAAAVENATDLTSLREGLRAATARAFQTDRAVHRFHRTQVFARAAANQRFRTALVPHQQRLDAAYADLFRRLQAKGLIDSVIDPAAGALFVQAYSFGMVINDITDHPVSSDNVVEVVMRVLERSFFIDDAS